MSNCICLCLITSNSTWVRLILEYDKLLVSVNLWLYWGPSPTPHVHDSKSIYKYWISKTWLFLGQLYYFTSWKCTVMISTFHNTSSSCPVSTSTSACIACTKSGESIPSCFCNRGAFACVQRLEDSLMYHIQRRQRMGEELSRSLVHQHGTHCPTTLKTAALLLSCLSDH